MTETPTETPASASTAHSSDLERAGYWYGEQSPATGASGPARPAASTTREREVLDALRTYRAAEVAMRRRTRESMAMGENELLVLRFLLRSEDGLVRPADITRYLGVSTASMTALLDRLAASGHIERIANPGDRRSILVRATPRTEAQVRATLGDMHARMHAAVEGMSPEDAEAVVAFLRRMSDAVDEIAPASS